jgi:hypothetical protein
MSNKKLGHIMALILLFFFISVYAHAGVTVYAEGAYTDTDLVVYIYADVDSNPILSYGVKLTYPSTLTLATGVTGDDDNDGVIKNSDDWYFGDSSPGYDTPNADPITSTSGEVVIVGGKLRTGDPEEGVVGTRVLLAMVYFIHSGVTDFTNIGLYLGKSDSYANFVQVDGELLDDDLAMPRTNPIGTVTIFKRGDADGNGTVDAMDILYVNNTMIPVDSFTCYADGDKNDVVDPMDLLWIKNNMD